MNMRKDLIEISASMFNGIFKHHHEVIVKQVFKISVAIDYFSVNSSWMLFHIGPGNEAGE